MARLDISEDLPLNEEIIAKFDLTKNGYYKCLSARKE